MLCRSDLKAAASACRKTNARVETSGLGDWGLNITLSARVTDATSAVFSPED